MAKLIAIDAGHGGILRDRYTTAPNKQFFHAGHTFHNGGWFYEGVGNRAVCDALCAMLEKEGIKYMKVYHPSLDTSLGNRVALANKAKATLFISNHSNASATHTAKGWEVFTSRGKSRSDDAATILTHEMRKRFPDVRYRLDFSDGDPDKEADFFVLRRTTMPSILVENFFFDNLQDAQLLIKPDVIQAIAEAQLELIKIF